MASRKLVKRESYGIAGIKARFKSVREQANKWEERHVNPKKK